MCDAWPVCTKIVCVVHEDSDRLPRAMEGKRTLPDAEVAVKAKNGGGGARVEIEMNITDFTGSVEEIGRNLRTFIMSSSSSFSESSKTSLSGDDLEMHYMLTFPTLYNLH